MPRAAAKHPRLASTLRGVRILPHARHPAHLHGEIVPWLRVWRRTLHDADGVPLRTTRGRSLRLPNDERTQRVARAMIARAHHAALARADYDITQRAGRDDLAGGWLLTLCPVVLAGILLHASWPRVLGILRAPAGATPGQLAPDVGLLVLMLLTFVVPAAAFWLVGIPTLLTARTTFRVTPTGVSAFRADDRAVSIPWAKARRVREFATVFVIKSRAGEIIAVPLGPAFFVLRHHARGGPIPTLHSERRNFRRWLRRTFLVTAIVSQVAAVIAAATAWASPGLFPRHPLVIYLCVACMAPFALGLPMLEAPLTRWTRRFSARRRSAR